MITVEAGAAMDLLLHLTDQQEFISLLHLLPVHQVQEAAEAAVREVVAEVAVLEAGLREVTKRFINE
jgi:hypothetical protein